MGLINANTEAQVLAAMINDRECLDTGMALLRPDHFGDMLYRNIFIRMQAMYSAGKHIDTITVYEEAKDLARGQGTAWLMVKDATWSGGTFTYWTTRLTDLAQKRKLAHLARQIVIKIENDDPAAEILTDTESQLYAIGANSEAAPIVTPKDHAIKMLDTLAARMDKRSNGGICTSYVKLNYALNGGLLPGQLIIFAAQTGKGKTAFALNLMRDIAVVQKKAALYVNTEMGDEQIACRWMTILTDNPAITHTKIATGQLSPEEQRIVMESMERMHVSGFHSITIPDLTINTLVSTARRFKAQKELTVLVVDYVGRMDTTDPKMQEWQVYKSIAKRLKTLAQEQQIAVIMLAQVTEDEKLEGARAMKNECDLFGYLRDATAEELTKSGNRFNYVLALDKNRDGRRMKIPLQFNGEKMRFKGESADELARSKQEPQANTSTTEVEDTYSGKRDRRYSKSRRMPYTD